MDDEGRLPTGYQTKAHQNQTQRLQSVVIEKIRLHNVSKSFDDAVVLKDINLSIKEGQITVLLGPSGCGKTTLLRLINRLEELDSGEILIENQSIKEIDKNQLRRSIGYVIQNIGLLPHLTVNENIQLPAKISGRPKNGHRTQELIELLGLEPSVGEKRPNQLSGGQQQRIGIARAMATESEVILMDEPFSALDNITRGQLQEDFLALKESQGKTVILVTHDVQEAFKLGDHIVLLGNGAIQQSGAPLDLLTKPANESVSSFLRRDRLMLALQLSQYKGRSVYDAIDSDQWDDKEKEAAFEELLKTL